MRVCACGVVGEVFAGLVAEKIKEHGVILETHLEEVKLDVTLTRVVPEDFKYQGLVLVTRQGKGEEFIPLRFKGLRSHFVGDILFVDVELLTRLDLIWAMRYGVIETVGAEGTLTLSDLGGTQVSLDDAHIESKQIK